MSFLESVTAERRADALRRRDEGALDRAKAAAATAPPALDFAAAIRRKPADGVRLVAEVKRASPAKGDIAPDADAAAAARAYEGAGAAAISVLTEPNHFKGSLDDLAAARGAVAIPVLRKDFACDPLHVWEARAAGADAILLIVAALTQTELVTLVDACSSLGMTADVEVHDAGDATRALDAGARVVAINARNLATLEVDLATIEKIRPLLPAGVVTVAESGIATRADAERMAAAGVDAIHVGETLMRAADPAKAIAMLLGR